jgi:hypothetical protein
MTEADWLELGDARALSFELEPGKWPRVTDRTLRLIGAACCRLVWDHLRDPRSRHIVELVERLADGKATWEDLTDTVLGGGLLDESYSDPGHALLILVRGIGNGRDHRISQLLGHLQRKMVSDSLAWLVRDVIGNPFRTQPAILTEVLAWNDGTVLRLAQGVYEERAFEQLPILADALLDAGCEQEELIGHCRSEGPHVRGCWGVDLILGRS